MAFMQPAPLCADLHAIVHRELKLGNALPEQPVRADWPTKGGVFAALRDDLHLHGLTLPTYIRHSVCTDPHYGWHDECFCERHGHLLVAGRTKR
ncbi:hypothetical protein [Burkholderia sp. 22313]|uniref:hypothetical protein n=1 Tax=Burkholderia sp. 22313 TaxID=3453908 RepID=UPI003F8365BD